MHKKAKSKIYLYTFIGVAVGLLVIAFVLYYMGQALISDYEAASASHSSLETLLGEDNSSVMSLQAVADSYNTSKFALSIASYILSILAIACVGLGLKFSDSAKEKEESFENTQVFEEENGEEESEADKKEVVSTSEPHE